MLFSELILDSIRKILFRLTEIIYLAIRGLYNLFVALSEFNLFTFDEVAEVYKRFEVVLAVVMVFYVSFTTIKYIVNPETVSDKEKGGANLLKKMVIVVLLMVFSPQIFEAAANLRTNIIKNGVIPQIVTGEAKTDKNAGGEFSSKILSLFYYAKKPDADCALELHILWWNTGLNLEKSYTCADVVRYNLDYIKNVDSISGGEKSFTNAITRADDDGYLLNFDAIYAIGVGLFVAWILLNYCAEAARVIFQLIFLEIIAPIPIMSYLSPSKDGTFQKWLRQLGATYFDVFLRLFIIYLMFFFSGKVLNVVEKVISEGANSNDHLLNVFLVIFLIIGLLYFASKAPALIKELLPKGLESAASGSFGFGRKSFQDRFNPAGKALGGALGLTRGVIKGAGRGVGALARDFQKNRFSVKDRLLGAADSAKRAGRRMRTRHRNRIDRFLGNDAASIATRLARDEYDRKLEAEADLSWAKKHAKNNADAKRFIANKHKIAALEQEKLSTDDTTRRDAIQREIDSLRRANDGFISGLSDNKKEALTKLADQSVTTTTTIKRYKDTIKEQQDIINDPTKSPEEKRAAELKIKETKSALKRVEISSTSGKVKEYVDSLNDKEAAEKDLKREEAEIAAGRKPAGNSDWVTAKAANNAAKARFQNAADSLLGKESGGTGAFEKGEAKGAINDAYRQALDASHTDVETARKDLFKKLADQRVAHWEEDAALRAERSIAQQDGGIIRAATGLVGGVISGAAKGVYEGVKTKGIETVLPDYVKGVKSDLKNESARQQFIDSGGVVGLGAGIDRAIHGAADVIGIPTTYENLNASIKPIELMAKDEEAVMKVENEASKSYDTMKSTLSSAREKNKFYADITTSSRITEELLTRKGPSGVSISEMLSHNELTWNGVKVTSLSQLDNTRNLIKALQSRTESFRIQYEEMQKKAATATGPDKDIALRDADILRAQWTAAQDDEQKLSAAIDRVTANALLHADTRDLVTASEPAVKTGITTMQSSVLAALSNGSTVSAVLETVGILSEETKRKIRSGNYDSLTVDNFNEINDALVSISGDRSTRLAQLHETVRRGTAAIAGEKAQNDGVQSGSSGGSGGGSGH